MKNDDYLSFDDYFIKMLEVIKLKSKDKYSKIGCVIVGENGQILSTGYNSFVRGVNDYSIEHQERPEKYFWFEHAERNAIYNAVRTGTSLFNSTLYVNGIPCHDCMRGIIQSGIRNIIVPHIGSYEFLERWGNSCLRSIQMVQEIFHNYVYYSSTKPIYLLFKNEVSKSFENNENSNERKFECMKNKIDNLETLLKLIVNKKEKEEIIEFCNKKGILLE